MCLLYTATCEIKGGKVHNIAMRVKKKKKMNDSWDQNE